MAAALLILFGQVFLDLTPDAYLVVRDVGYYFAASGALFLVVMMCVVVDVFILTIASSVNSARLKPIQTRDVRHGTTEVDVGKMSVTVVLAITYLSAGGRDHIESHGAFVCFPLETHLAWNVVWLQGNHSDNWSDSCPKHEEH